MTDPSPGRKRKIKIAASSDGVKTAERALIRLGLDTKFNFAKSRRIAPNTVTKFFLSEPIQLDSFKRICEELRLDWLKIAELTEERTVQTARNDCISSDTNEGVEQVQTLCRQVTVIDKQSKTITAEIKLKGNINSVQNLEILTSILRTYSGETIEITDIKEGSIRLIVKGSQEDIEQLVSRIKSGELTELSGFPVEDIQILSESLDDESNELDDKWRLVQEIVSQAVEGRNLSGADLSDTDLRGANLRGADLRDADLRDADLRDADLRDADLRDADLSGANLRNTTTNKETKLDHKWHLVQGIVTQGAEGRDLSGANLSGADLRYANLSGADLRDADLRYANLRYANLRYANLRYANLRYANLRYANLKGVEVENARFGDNLGISESIKRDLFKRGAIFEDSPGDRSGVLIPL